MTKHNWPLFEKFVGQDDLEMELRLGRQKGDKWVSGVTKQHYLRLKSSLDSCVRRKLCQHAKVRYNDTYWEQSGRTVRVRQIGDSQTEVREIIHLERRLLPVVHQDSKEEDTYDLRLGLKQEKVLSDEEQKDIFKPGSKWKVQTKRSKDVDQYIFAPVRYDLSEIPDVESGEVELEFTSKSKELATQKNFESFLAKGLQVTSRRGDSSFC